MARRPTRASMPTLTAASDLIAFDAKTIENPRQRQQFEILQDQLRNQALEAERTIKDRNQARAEADQLKRDLSEARREMRTAEQRVARFEEQAAQVPVLRAEVNDARAQTNQLETALRARDASIEELMASRRELSSRLVELEADAARATRLQSELVSLQSQLSARDKLIELLQAQQAAGARGQTEAPRKEPKDIIAALQADFAAMSAEPSRDGFTIDDVEIDLVAPLDVENNRAVMRFDPTALNTPEGASRIRFRLSRNVNLRSTEDDAE